jgi:ArsR family transcriptional regulator, arsenate/arsenite/antimonite-responsive transcriptional repressor
MQPDFEDVATFPSLALTVHPGMARNEVFLPPPMAITPGDFMRNLMAMTKALADENRVRMLLALRRQELCVCQIVELIQLATSTVSKHMSILKAARLVESRKDGRWLYYRLPGKEAPATVKKAMEWIFESVAKEPQALRDQIRLDEILRIDIRTLCASEGTSSK